MTTIAVAGGTGVVGSHVVEEVRRRDATPVVIARSRGVDLTTGDGVADALSGADVVIDVSNRATLRARPAIVFFETATRTLLREEQRAGTQQHVALSIVGCDRVDLPYYLGKRRQEELIRTASVPWTIVRATQFHEFPAQLLEHVHGPVAPVPKLLSQPVAAREVAESLVDIALGEPASHAPDVAGPEQRLIPDMARRLVSRRGRWTKVVDVPIPGRVGRQIADGGLLPGDGATIGTETYDDWLAREVS